MGMSPFGETVAAWLPASPECAGSNVTTSTINSQKNPVPKNAKRHTLPICSKLHSSTLYQCVANMAVLHKMRNVLETGQASLGSNFLQASIRPLTASDDLASAAFSASVSSSSTIRSMPPSPMTAGTPT